MTWKSVVRLIYVFSSAVLFVFAFVLLLVVILLLVFVWPDNNKVVLITLDCSYVDVL